MRTIDTARAWLQMRRAVPPDDPDRCTRCGEPFMDGVRVGDGDGDGQKFAHRKCYDMGRAEEESLAALLDAVDRETSERWGKAMKAADWDGGVFHYDGRIYPWPRGFVPDVPATWLSKTVEARKAGYDAGYSQGFSDARNETELMGSDPSISGIENPLDDAQTERILRGVLERLTTSAKERGDVEVVESLSDVNGLVVEAMASRKKVQNEAAGEAAAPELLKAGWIPDVPGGRTHWLHAKLAPVVAVSSKKALELQRRSEE